MRDRRYPARTVRSRGLAALLAGIVAVVAVLAGGCGSGDRAPAATGCRITYVARAQPSGFTADVAITSDADRRTWTLAYDFADPDQRVRHAWGGSWSQTGTRVTVTGTDPLRRGAALTLGFNGTAGTADSPPTGFSLDGVACAASTDVAVGSAPRRGPGAAPELRVQGNRIVEADGRPANLVGVNRSGGEFQCVHGTGPWDGPVGDAAVAAIASWHVTAVRVALNADCWLGVGSAVAAQSGARYRQAVASFVATLEAHGLVPILELHWTHGRYTGGNSQCRSSGATCQKPMPDAQYSPAFWGSVADTFRDDRAVVFDLFNEPYPSNAGTMSHDESWQCWLRGRSACPGLGYQAAGMQELLDAVRRVGASNMVLASGNGYADDLAGWLAHRPSDPTGNLAAAWHAYDISGCARDDCWNAQVAPVAAQVPVVATEIGEMDCAHGFVDRLMPWLDAHAIGYLAWTWNVWDCRTGPALISDYDGTPTPFGVGVRDHLLAR